MNDGLYAIMHRVNVIRLKHPIATGGLCPQTPWFRDPPLHARMFRPPSYKILDLPLDQTVIKQ